MEDILIKRLSMFAAELKLLSDKSLNLCDNLNNQNLEAARIIRSKLQSILNRFNPELFNYFTISKNPNADEISELTSVQLKGEETLAELNEKIKIITDINTPAQTNTANQRLGMSSRLPKLDLPEFTGDVLEWHQFWDRFSSNIDTRELHDVDKLLYLKASLTGEAKKSVEGLDTTNKNYQIAVTTLKERYGKESQIIDAHYSALYKVKAAENTANCRTTLDEIERHLRVLNSLGENTNHNHLRFLVMEKFPEEIIYEMKLKSRTETIEDIRKHLEIIISAKEDANRMKIKPVDLSSYTVETLHVTDETRKYKGNNENSNTYSKFHNQYKRKFEQTGDVNYRNSNNKKYKIICIFCQENHYNDECNKVKTLEERKAKLRNRCYICFRQGHLSSRCQWKRTCIHCGEHGRHNRAMCPEKLNSKTETDTSP